VRPGSRPAVLSPVLVREALHPVAEQGEHLSESGDAEGEFFYLPVGFAEGLGIGPQLGEAPSESEAEEVDGLPVGAGGFGREPREATQLGDEAVGKGGWKH
jgi:hypothetical protein